MDPVWLTTLKGTVRSILHTVPLFDAIVLILIGYLCLSLALRLRRRT